MQDQLFSKDLPLIKKALGYTGRIALLKGRRNYLCLERLESYYRAGGEFFPETRSEVTKVKEWSLKTTDGDISKCTTVAEDDPIWPLITSTNDNCLGIDCPDYEHCYVMKARRSAIRAGVIIVNHHLFFCRSGGKRFGFW